MDSLTYLTITNIVDGETMALTNATFRTMFTDAKWVGTYLNGSEVFNTSSYGVIRMDSWSYDLGNATGEAIFASSTSTWDDALRSEILGETYDNCSPENVTIWDYDFGTETTSCILSWSFIDTQCSTNNGKTFKLFSDIWAPEELTTADLGTVTEDGNCTFSSSTRGQFQVGRIESNFMEAYLVTPWDDPADTLSLSDMSVDTMHYIIMNTSLVNYDHPSMTETRLGFKTSDKNLAAFKVHSTDFDNTTIVYAYSAGQG